MQAPTTMVHRCAITGIDDAVEVADQYVVFFFISMAILKPIEKIKIKFKLVHDKLTRSNYEIEKENNIVK